MSRLAEVVALMATDSEFAQNVRRDPGPAARHYGLTPEEASQLAALADAEESSGPAQLGARLSKSSIGSGGLSSLLQSISAPEMTPDVAAPLIDPTHMQSATPLPGVAMPIEIQQAPMTSLLPPIEQSDALVAPAPVGIVGPDAPPDPLPADKLAEPFPADKLAESLPADKLPESLPADKLELPEKVDPSLIEDKGAELDPRIAEEKGAELDPRIAAEKGAEPIQDDKVEAAIAAEKGTEPEPAGSGIIGPEKPVELVSEGAPATAEADPESTQSPDVTAPEPGASEIVGPDQPVQSTDPDGSRHVRVFDSAGNLTTETVYASNGDVGQIAFNGDGTIAYSGTLHHIDAGGRDISTTYAADGSYTETTDYGWSVRHYDADGQVTTATASTPGYLPTNRDIDVHSEFVYDADGRITTATHTWDDAGGHHVMRLGDPLVDVTIAPNGNRIETTYAWNLGNPYRTHQVVDMPDGGHTEATFDRVGTRIQYSGIGLGDVVDNGDGTTTVTDTASDGTRSVGIYDSSGRLTHEMVYAPNGDQGETTTNADGSVTRTGLFHSVDSGGRHIVSDYAADGTHTETTDYGSTVRNYDSSGRITSMTEGTPGYLPSTRDIVVQHDITFNPDGTFATNTHSWDDANGHHVMRLGDPLVDVATAPNGSRVETTYAWNTGRPYMIHQTEDTPDGRHTDATFDSTGTRTSFSGTLAGGGIVNADGTTTLPTVDAEGIRHVGTYSATGRLVHETVYAPNGDVGEVTYNEDGTVTRSGIIHFRDPDGRHFVATYATDGSHIETDDGAWTTRRYDTSGHLTSMTESTPGILPINRTIDVRHDITFNPDGSFATNTHTWDDASGHHVMTMGSPVVDIATQRDGTLIRTTYEWRNGAYQVTGSTRL